MITATLRALRTNILVGLMMIAPLAITFAVVEWLFNLFTGQFLSFFPREWADQFLVRVAAFFAILILLFFIGLLVRNVLGRQLYHFWDRLLGRIPVVNKIYISIRQIFEALLSNRDALFKEVVLCEYPHPGIYALGFVTAVVPEEIARKTSRRDADDEVLSIFIPTTPNPTSGWFCMLPRSRLQNTDITPGEAMKLIMSGGATFAGTPRGMPNTGLLEKVDQWVAEGHVVAPRG